MPYQPGEQVGDYQVLEILGGGGMGAVYKVRNVLSGRVDAMKVVLENLQDHAEVLDRFLREIRVLASLEHPNIAALRTAQRVDRQILMIMELVEGETLQSALDRGRLPLPLAVRYVRDALAGLAYAHERGIIHRDVKPANMMVNPQGELKLMDFGIARLATDQSLTKTGLTVGSLFYMSPEQINGGAIDGRSDLYSVGVTLYQLATGRRPFEGTSDFTIMAAHVNERPRPPVELDPAVPPELSEIIMMALEKDPAKRFANAAAMGKALEAVLAEVGGAAPAARGGAAVQPLAVSGDAPERKGGPKRGLYILAGSLATIAVFVVAATQVPKWWSTQAQPPAAAPVAQPQVAAPPVQPPAATPAAPEPVLAAPPAAVARVPAPVPPRTAKAAARSDVPALDVRPQKVPATPPAAVNQPAAPPAAVVPSQPIPQPDRSEAAVTAQRERFTLLATRAVTVRDSLQRLRDQQARMGLGLRADLASAEQRLLFRMDSADAAIKGGDAKSAGEQMDSAERELAILERALGH